MNCFAILINKKTWIGYSPQLIDLKKSLPKIKTGVLYPGIQLQTPNIHMLEQAHIQYAKDYKVRNDLMLIIRNFRFLGTII